MSESVLSTESGELPTIARISTRSDKLPVKENQNLDALPGSYGWPIIGDTFKMLADPRGSLFSAHARYGNVIKSSALFQRSVSLLGPDANELVLMDRDKNFSSRWGWHAVLDRLFRNGLMLRDFEDHRAHRRIMNAAFRPQALESYIDQMNPVINSSIQQWENIADFRFYDAIKQLTLDVAAVVFIGINLGKDSEKVNQAFIDTVAATLAVVRFPVPGLSLWKGIKGREFLISYFGGMIAEKRISEGQDMLSHFCKSKNEEGEYYSDADIVDHMIFLMMAAHDTTTSALSTMVLALAEHPEWQDKVREECLALHKACDNEHLAFSDLDKLEKTAWVFKEALRLYTPVTRIARRSIKSFEFEGHTIPANTLVGISPTFTHYMPEIWNNPEAFEPDRFSPQRAEDKKHNFAWVPFSKGAHMCIGLHFAYMQVKAVMYQFIRQYEFSLPENYVLEMQELPIPKPKDKLPLHLHRIVQRSLGST